MKNTLFSFAVLFFFFGCKNIKLIDNPCPTTCPLGSLCTDGICECLSPNDRLINHKWCTPIGSFVAYVDRWYDCVDTFSFILIVPPNPRPPGTISNAEILFYNRIDGDHRYPHSTHGYAGVREAMFYYPLPDGDSIEVWGVTTGVITTDLLEGRAACRMSGGTCNVIMLGKFRSADTIDLKLKMLCRPPTIPEHGQEIKVLAVRVK